MKKTLILGLIAMMALVANAQDQKKAACDNKCKTEKCEKKACDKKACDKKACDKADKKACCNKEKKCCDKAKKTDGQTGATKQEGKK
jgi:hypothetical protein